MRHSSFYGIVATRFHREGVSVAHHPVDTANEYLRALGYSATDAHVYSVFDAGGESALIRVASVGERFVPMGEVERIVAELPLASEEALGA